MILKKYAEFFKSEPILENYSGNKELIVNKDELIQKMKDLPKSNHKNWGHEGDNLDYDMREVFFQMWQDDTNTEITDRASMTHYALEHYGVLAAFNILLAGYIGQVNNGGHSQYLGNGYASEERRGNDTDLHDLLIELWELSGFNKFSKSGKLSLQVAKDLEVGPSEYDCDYCGGSGEEEEEEEFEDDDGDTYTETQYTTCGQCNGDGTVEDDSELQAYNGKELDTRLYDVNGSISDDFERFLAIKFLD